MIAELSSGNVDFADVLFLLSFLAFVIGGIAVWVVRSITLQIGVSFVCFGFALTALAFFVL